MISERQVLCKGLGRQCGAKRVTVPALIAFVFAISKVLFLFWKKKLKQGRAAQSHADVQWQNQLESSFPAPFSAPLSLKGRAKGSSSPFSPKHKHRCSANFSSTPPTLPTQTLRMAAAHSHSLGEIFLNFYRIQEQ